MERTTGPPSFVALLTKAANNRASYTRGETSFPDVSIASTRTMLPSGSRR
jgi:hypothetical protein